MDIVQLALLGVAGFIAYSIFAGGNKKKDDKDAKKVEDTKEDTDKQDKVVVEDHSFMCLVEKWSDLRDCCHQQGLHDACDLLDDEIFPLLNSKKKDKVK